MCALLAIVVAGFTSRAIRPDLRTIPCVQGSSTGMFTWRVLLVMSEFLAADGTRKCCYRCLLLMWRMAAYVSACLEVRCI